MIVGFLIVLVWMMFVVISGVAEAPAEALLFGSQLDEAALSGMGIHSDADKFIFSVNLLVGPACALALNTADFGRYGKSAGHVAAAAVIAIFFQSLLMMLVGGLLMKSAAPAMVSYFTEVAGMAPEAARRQVLQSPDSIAATFMVFGGTVGFLLMILAQAKAQVLNTYSSSLCIANLFDAVFRWRPGRIAFVVLANLIALLMLYGKILHFVEEWIKLLGVLLSALATTIILDYHIVSRRGIISRWGVFSRRGATALEPVNWAGVIAILAAVVCAHWLFRPYQPIEVLTSIACVAVIYLPLRLTVLRPRGPV
jgi:cytosine permease